MEERVTNLEIKLTYMEDLVEQLNQELIASFKKIEKLEREIEELKEAVSADDIKPNEKPPHY